MQDNKKGAGSINPNPPVSDKNDQEPIESKNEPIREDISDNGSEDTGMDAARKSLAEEGIFPKPDMGTSSNSDVIKRPESSDDRTMLDIEETSDDKAPEPTADEKSMGKNISSSNCSYYHGNDISCL